MCVHMYNEPTVHCVEDIIYRIAGKFDGQNIWRFAPPEVLGGFKFGDG